LRQQHVAGVGRILKFCTMCRNGHNVEVQK